MKKNILLILVTLYLSLYNFIAYSQSVVTTPANPITSSSNPAVVHTPLIQAAIDNKNELLAPNGNYSTKANDKQTLVVFYDYNCTYSRELFGILANELAKTSANYTIIYKPVGMVDDLTSRLAAELVTAANDPSINKFQELHNALINPNNILPYTEDNLKLIVKNLNLDYDNLLALVKNKQLADVILKNHVIYDKLRLPGVPGIIAAKLDDQMNIVDNKIYYIAGTDSHNLEISLFNLRT